MVEYLSNEDADCLLVVPYQEPPLKEGPSDISSTMGSTLPMAAMFTRNKYIGWLSVVFALQGWLSEGPEARKAASTPAVLTVGMSLMALVVTYLPLFLPPPVIPGTKSATGPQATPGS